MTAERAWRITATAFCFAVFGLGGLGFLLLGPLLTLIPGTARRHAFTRGLMRRGMGAFVLLMRGCGVISLSVHDAHRLQRRGQFILANHPSLLDVVLLIALTPHADCVVKAALWRNPFLRWPVAAAGFLRNDDGPGVVDAAIRSVRNGNNLIVFPEGTRSMPGAGLRFLRGAGNIAVRGELAVTPVLIVSSEPMLPKHRPWYRVPRRRPHFTVRVLDDLSPTALVPEPIPAGLGARRYTERLQQRFTEEIARHEPATR
ncbi:lysophospholipid acyltransferase family protein [Chitiniphilus eburneus]|uniref:1-acyl-sn-glycerol-3-phosphate acyltransferase n=1 Tax=Chitiniphilus eburneus TaxID=2571148 RepID=A0A4U0PDG9_9NEIS|nr:lysophospholipid acyltransferase family protein [Chitiniphilus eburneus]TJZ65823.1 1-acyl-sn-glycerol-3-phosphate acyltransferase [Chitiniphilus eburneus]